MCGVGGVIFRISLDNMCCVSFEGLSAPQQRMCGSNKFVHVDDKVLYIKKGKEQKMNRDNQPENININMPPQHQHQRNNCLIMSRAKPSEVIAGRTYFSAEN